MKHYKSKQTPGGVTFVRSVKGEFCISTVKLKISPWEGTFETLVFPANYAKEEVFWSRHVACLHGFTQQQAKQNHSDMIREYGQTDELPEGKLLT